MVTVGVGLISLFSFCQARPRAVLGTIAALCVGLLAFGLYLQHGMGLEPCPMCIVQRYALMAVAVIALVGAAWPGGGSRRWSAGMVLLSASFGAFVAARQSWLQWFPPEIVTCGRDFYGMIESFPLKRAVPMIFRGTGDCTAIDWTFLGLTIANWSFLNFVLLAVAALVLLLPKR